MDRSDEAPIPRPPRRALVTGASSGIGAALAVELARTGYDLALVARDPVTLGHTARLVHAWSAHTDVLVADLATPAGLHTVETYLHAHDIHLLINNAATGQHRPFHEQDPERITETVLLNALAPARLLRAALPAMIARGRGGIVTISSPAGERPAPDLALYGATRALLISLDRSLRAELATQPGIVVTTVLPGWTRTGFHTRLEQDVADVPENAWNTPEDVAVEALRRHHLGDRLVRIPEPTSRERLTATVRHLRRRVPEPVRRIARLSRRLPTRRT